ncbi:Retrovirus-related Pol polyprotein from transposon TNT 1-94 [Sesamum angolense]|uniref:Retrovirus-related Pol polyprotein from transposon TNT 1-94 n=1 Tax=Sesamum angolense TaxID=2727404 RepID=A0AAE1WDJ9_9LAMI|nr:Retrovirus-related Pol polyprotein from transposon TNT 1-94 [Sesamum angolense]
MVVGGSSGASTSGATEGYVSVQPELLTIYKPCDWLIDTGVNVHVCADKSLFVSYQAITRKTVSMGNSSAAEVLGIESVDLKFPSGRILSLKRFHHVPIVRRNIISGSVIVREGYELAFKFNKVVIQQFETPPYSPSSNRVAEWKNRTFKDMINSLILTSELPKYLWGEALNTACDILKHNMSTPFELWKCRKPSLKYFRVWGYLAKVLVPEHKRKKLGPKTIDAVFLGYVETSYALRFLDDPVTFKDAVFSETKQWKEAVKSEMDSIVSNGTWVLVDLPPGCTTIGSRLTTIRVLIALASMYNLLIHQMDVKTAFLYGELEEKIYMDQPEGFVAHGNERKVCKLVKSLYGLKQAPKQWHEKSNQTILAFGFTYLANGTRPDISFSVSKLARYTSCPDKTRWGALDRVLRYLKGTVSLAIHYGRFPVVLEGYSDASWIAKNSGSNGCSGYIFTLGGAQSPGSLQNRL